MSVQGTIRFSVMLAVGLMVGAGCSSGNSVGQANSGPYDYEALDSYLSDAKDPAVRANLSPTGSVKTVGTRSLDRSSTSRKSKSPVPRGNFPKGKVFGEWVGNIDMAAAMDDAAAESAANGDVDPEFAALGEQMGKAMAEMMSSMFAMSLDLHKDYTFEGIMMVMPFEGNWKQQGDRLFLTPTKIMGLTEQDLKDMADKMADGFKSNDGMDMQMTSSDFKPMELRIAENGNALIAIDPDDASDQDLVFRRKQ